MTKKITPKVLLRSVVFFLSAFSIVCIVLFLQRQKDHSEPIDTPATETRTFEESLENLSSNNPKMRGRALLEVSEAISNKQMVQVSDSAAEWFVKAMELQDVERPISQEFGSYYDSLASTFAKLPRTEKIVTAAKEKVFSQETNSLAKIGWLRYLNVHDKATFNRYLNRFVEGGDYERMDPDLRMYLGGYEEISRPRNEYFERLTRSFMEWQPASDADVNPFRQEILKHGRLIAYYYAQTYHFKENTVLPERIVSVLIEMGGYERVFSVLWADYIMEPREITALGVGSSMGSGYIVCSDALTAEQNQQLARWVLGDMWPQVSGLSQQELAAFINAHLLEIREACKKRASVMAK